MKPGGVKRQSVGRGANRGAHHQGGGRSGLAQDTALSTTTAPAPSNRVVQSPVIIGNDSPNGNAQEGVEMDREKDQLTLRMWLQMM